MMTDDELDALLAARKAQGTGSPIQRPSEFQDEELDALMAKYRERQPPEPKKQYAPPTLLNQALHVAKGIPANIIGTAELPYGIERLVQLGAEATGLESRPVTESKTGYSTQPWTQVLTEALGGDYGQLREALAGDVVDPNQAPVAEALRTGLEWMSPKKMFVDLPQAGLRSLAKRPQRLDAPTTGDVVGELAVGGSAAAGQEALRQLNSQEVAKLDPMFGELMGGGSAALVQALLSRRPGSVTQAEAMNAILRNMSPDEIARVEAAAQRGDMVGSLADVAQSQNLQDIGVTIGQSDRVAGRELERLSDEVAQTGAERILREFGTGDGQAAADTARANVQSAQERLQAGADARAQRIQSEAAAETQRIEAQDISPQRQAILDAEQRLIDAEQQATRSQEALDVAAEYNVPTRETYEASADFQNRVNEAERAFQSDVVDEAYNAFASKSPPIAPSEVNTVFSDFLKKLKLQERSDFVRKFTGELESNWLWKDDKRPVSAQNALKYIQNLKRKAFPAKKEGESYTREEVLLQDFVRQLEDALVKRETSLPETERYYQMAKDAATEKYQRFRDPALIGSRNAPPEQALLTLLGSGSDQAATTARLLRQLDMPEATQDVVDYLRRQASLQGGVDQKFVDKYRGVIEQLPPDIRSNFVREAESRVAAETMAQRAQQQQKMTASESKIAETTIAEAESQQRTVLQKALKDAQAAQTQAGTRIQGLEKTVIGRFAKEPVTYLKSLVGNPDKSSELTRLADYMKRNGQADAFNGAVRDLIDNDILRLGNNTPAVRLDSLKKLNATVSNLSKSGVIDDATVQRVLKAIDDSAIPLSQRADAIRSFVVSGSDELNNLTASLISAGILQGLSGTQNLMLGGAVRRFVLNKLRGQDYKPEEVRLLEEFMLNPAKFMQEMPRLQEMIDMGDAERIARTLGDIFSRQAKAGQAVESLNQIMRNPSGEPEEEQK